MRIFLYATALSVAAGIAPAAAGQPTGHGAYGGGFIEFLMTGGETNSGVLYNHPQPMPQRQAMMVAPAAVARPRAAPAMAEPDAKFQRQPVVYDGHEPPGTIIVDTPHKFLYLVTAPGHAIRYGIGVGRPGFTWAGVKTITRKAEWPGWTPPPDMLKRRPDLPIHMAGGPGNPLGARALYLGSSLYRIHGTNEPDTIGKNLSSGCIRMMNQDVIDLYNRVHVGTRVIVM